MNTEKSERVSKIGERLRITCYVLIFLYFITEYFFILTKPLVNTIWVHSKD